MKNLYLALLLALCLSVLVAKAQDFTDADADDVSGNVFVFCWENCAKVGRVTYVKW